MDGLPLPGTRHALAAATPPALIRRSWARCAQWADDLPDDPVALGRGDLDARHEQHASMLRAAQPEIDTLASLVASASSLVLLADASGVILQATGNTDFLRRADRVALRPGVSWAENHRGTNAIGTALAEAAPLCVHGAEHFLPRNQILSCHAAPIRSPRGDILGVLDISGDAQRLHAYALGLATLCARQVANRLMLHAGPRCQQLVFHHQAGMLETADRGLLLIEDGRVVGANDAALALLRTDWRRLLDQPVERWLPNWRALPASPASLRGHDGQALFALLRQPAEPPAGTPVWTRAQADTPASPKPPGPATPAPAQPTRAPAVRTDLLPPLDPALETRFTRSRRALDAGLAVLLQGETGAGKEVYARHLHQASRWHAGPLVAVNCGALPDTLIEAELFGYEAGAYTGARRQGARGRLREADGGILFLDEIGDMPLTLQTRLLRVLQERTVQPLGAGRAVPVEFGLVSASNRDLAAMVETGAFRADLYYRLQDCRVDLPPLRSRADLRAHVCTTLHACAAPAAPPTLDDGALAQLARYPWPGNYRQLQAVLRGLALFHPPGSLIRVGDLPEEIQACRLATAHQAQDASSSSQAAQAPDIAAHATLRSQQSQQISEALARHGGNISRAARDLGIHRSTLHRHLARPGMPGPIHR